MMDIFLQLLANGLVIGSIYALVSSGFALIYHTNKFVHFAHGGVVMLSSYGFFWFFTEIRLTLVFSSIMTILFSALLGFLIDSLVYEPLRRKAISDSVMMISSMAVLIILESLSLLLFDASTKMINLTVDGSMIHALGTSETYLQAIIFTVATALFLLLYLFMNKTRYGLAMQAVADNKDLAEIIGISSEKIFLQSTITGSAIAGVAAILISLEQGIQSTMGTNLMIKGFASSIIGGMGSVPGAILGSFLLGISENFSTWIFSSGYRDAITFMLLFAFLIFKPSGIMGTED